MITKLVTNFHAYWLALLTGRAIWAVGVVVLLTMAFGVAIYLWGRRG